MNLGPQRIVCLTEEPTERLYLLGEARRIVGTSGCTVSPPQARVDKSKEIAFSDWQASGKRVSTFYQDLQ
jgi:iron complex transport system substrate-binding protein